MAKRVDFSLGMKDLSTGDEMGDVYEDRDPSQYRNLIRETNRIEEERRASESRDRSGSVARNSSSQVRTSMSQVRDRSGSVAVSQTRASGGLLRRATEQLSSPTHGRGSFNSMEMHRNRFLSRLGRGKSGVDDQRDVEAGPIDPRSGQITSQAVRMDSMASIQPDPTVGSPLMPTTSHSRDFGMNRSDQQPGQDKQA
jgi:hypothetical protein